MDEALTNAENLIRSHRASGNQSAYLAAGLVLLDEIADLRAKLNVALELRLHAERMQSQAEARVRHWENMYKAASAKLAKAWLKAQVLVSDLDPDIE